MGKKPAHSTATNGSVLNIASILCNSVSSATENDYGGMFMNAKSTLPLQQALIEMGHKQPPMLIQSDNNTAKGVANETIKQRHLKTIDMHHHWIQDQV